MKIQARIEDGERPRVVEVRGRMAWTLARLAEAGVRGVTSLEEPAPRLAAYVHRLRQQGFPIDTELEDHGGPFPGRHARYRLACDMTVREV